MVYTLTRDELKAKLDRRERMRLVEALPEETFQRSHIPGAINIPPERLNQLAAQLLPDKSEEVVVYSLDVACPYGKQVAQALAEMGYQRVDEFPGGKIDWLEHRLPLAGTDPANPLSPESRLHIR